MSEKPILFNTEMVRAILDGRKTQTRRVIRFPEGTTGHLPPSGAKDYIYWPGGIKRAPYKPGDTLWVRETWKQYTTGTAGPGLIDGYMYKANEPQDTSGMMVEDRWHPSIHMPKAAARIYLQVKDVWVERLQDIDEAGVCEEGAARIISSCEYIDYYFSPPEPCFNAHPCKDCIINYSYPELFGKMVWDKTVKAADLPCYGWDANPWVWVISFERIERDRLLRYADNDVMQGGLAPAT